MLTRSQPPDVAAAVPTHAHSSPPPPLSQRLPAVLLQHPPPPRRRPPRLRPPPRGRRSHLPRAEGGLLSRLESGRVHGPAARLRVLVRAGDRQDAGAWSLSRRSVVASGRLRVRGLRCGRSPTVAPGDLGIDRKVVVASFAWLQSWMAESASGACPRVSAPELGSTAPEFRVRSSFLRRGRAPQSKRCGMVAAAHH